MLNQESKEALHDQGFCVIPGVLDAETTDDTRTRLFDAAIESERRGMPTHFPGLDPNRSNVRVFNLLNLDPVFVDLISHPLALEIARYLLTDDFIISNFTANIAKPGSESMVVHSDLSVVLPEPWHSPWSMNIIWCLDDVTEVNGATRYLPGSHKLHRREQLPDDPSAMMVPFKAAAGSIIAMDGRLWHTSGRNRTENEDRAMLFGYYSRAFIRPQWNFSEALSTKTRATLSPELVRLLGLEIAANVRPLN